MRQLCYIPIYMYIPLMRPRMKQIDRHFSTLTVKHGVLGASRCHGFTVLLLWPRAPTFFVQLCLAADLHVSFTVSAAPPCPLLHRKAVAEQGLMWVPVSGSWRNPAIYSRRLLDEAVRQLFQ